MGSKYKYPYKVGRRKFDSGVHPHPHTHTHTHKRTQEKAGIRVRELQTKKKLWQLLEAQCQGTKAP